MGHDPIRGSGHGVLTMSRVGSGRVRKCSKSHGSGRVRSGQKFFKIHGSGRVKNFSNLRGRVRSGREVMKSSRVRSGQEVMQNSRVGSGHEHGSLAGRASMTREFFSADPWARPAHPARGSDT